MQLQTPHRHNTASSHYCINSVYYYTVHVQYISVKVQDNCTEKGRETGGEQGNVPEWQWRLRWQLLRTNATFSNWTIL